MGICFPVGLFQAHFFWSLHEIKIQNRNVSKVQKWEQGLFKEKVHIRMWVNAVPWEGSGWERKRERARGLLEECKLPFLIQWAPLWGREITLLLNVQMGWSLGGVHAHCVIWESFHGVSMKDQCIHVRGILVLKETQVHHGKVSMLDWHVSGWNYSTTLETETVEYFTTLLCLVPYQFKFPSHSHHSPAPWISQSLLSLIFKIGIADVFEYEMK